MKLLLNIRDVKTLLDINQNLVTFTEISTF